MKMRKNRDDIPEDGTDPQVWLDYLDGKLPEEERQHLEEEIAHSEFLREALEGLLPLKGTVDLREVTRQLNRQLDRQLSTRKRGRLHSPQHFLLWACIALVVVLTVIMLGYYFYSHLHK